MKKVKPKLKQSDWDKIEKEFLAGLSLYFSEIHLSIKNLRKNKDNPFVRSQLCLAFIGVDTFSRFYKIFKGERKNIDAKNEKRFKEWLKSFVFTKENEVYKKYRSKIKCDANVAYKMRNSFLHFYSFPRTKKGQSKICFYFGNISEQRHNEIEKKFKERGHNVVFINAYFLIEAILEGFLLQLNKMKEIIKKDPNNYIDSVLFAHEIIRQENASTILINRI